MGAVALPATAADHDHGRSHGESVFISGVQYESPGRVDRSNHSLNKEWVDITNGSRRAVNLDGWTLSGENGNTYTFHHVWLDRRSTVRLHTGVGRDTKQDLYQDRRSYVWDDNGDTATLRDDYGRFVDNASWGRHHHHHGGDYRHGDYRHGDYRHGGDYRHDGDRHHDGDHRHGGDDRRHADDHSGGRRH